MCIPEEDLPKYKERHKAHHELLSSKEIPAPKIKEKPPYKYKLERIMRQRLQRGDWYIAPDPKITNNLNGYFVANPDCEEERPTEHKWCNTCEHESGLYAGTCGGRLYVPVSGLLSWQRSNRSAELNDRGFYPRTAADVKSSCPGHKPRVKKNCESCGHHSSDAGGDPCSIVWDKEGKLFDLVIKWVNAVAGDDSSKLYTADNCPGWKER
jgi:hypothetical protein